MEIRLARTLFGGLGGIAVLTAIATGLRSLVATDAGCGPVASGPRELSATACSPPPDAFGIGLVLAVGVLLLAGVWAAPRPGRFATVLTLVAAGAGVAMTTVPLLTGLWLESPGAPGGGEWLVLVGLAVLTAGCTGAWWAWTARRQLDWGAAT